MKRVWIVTVEVDVPVYAETEDEAVRLGEEYAYEELKNGPTGTSALEVEYAGGETAWGDIPPWGDDKFRTTAELMREWREAEKPT